jgi:hypothetical protein
VAYVSASENRAAHFPSDGGATGAAFRHAPTVSGLMRSTIAAQMPPAVPVGGRGREAPARDGKAGGGSDNPCRKSGTPPTQHYQTERFFRCSDARRNLTTAVALRFGVLHVSTLTFAEAACALGTEFGVPVRMIRDRLTELAVR